MYWISMITAKVFFTIITSKGKTIQQSAGIALNRIFFSFCSHIEKLLDSNLHEIVIKHPEIANGNPPL